MTQRRNAIVVVVDRLSCGYLGPYGNTWLETPAINHLACRAALWEQAIALEPTVAGFYRSLVHGRHPAEAVRSQPIDWCRPLRDSGVHVAFLHDDPTLTDSEFATMFPERVRVEPGKVAKAAASPEETELARTFLAAMEWLAGRSEPFLLWFHTRGMAGPWDAPTDFRQRFRDEEDPVVPDFVTPPSRVLAANPDPDEMLALSHAYAGQVTLLDLCLEMLWEQLAEQGLLESTLVILTSPRGFPLGEHGGVGDAAVELHEELVHVPLLVCSPRGAREPTRCHGLAQSTDLLATLAEWFEVKEADRGVSGLDLAQPPVRSEEVDRSLIVSTLGAAQSIRTREWFLTTSPNRVPALFAKPDDRSEVNDVAGRCARDMANLLETLGQSLASLSAGSPTSSNG